MLKFYQAAFAAILICSSEYGWIDKSVIRVLIIFEEISKYYMDTLVSITFGATITRFSEESIGATFVSFLHSLSSLAYNFPSTIVLMFQKLVPIWSILLVAILL